MGNRGWLVGVAAVLLMLAAWFVLRPGGDVPTAHPAGGNGGETATAPAATAVSPSSSPTTTPFAAAAASRPAKGAVAKPAAPPPLASAPPVPRSSDAAMAEAMKVQRMVIDYHTLMGENPVGTNAEIMRAVMGGNPHQAQLGPPEGQTLNDKGELVDPWGTPYFFHQLSRDYMEIHSAGPDRILGTADDVVVP